MGHYLSWIDSETAATYFELITQPPETLRNIELMASKTYTRGLIIISIFFESTLYFVVQGGEGDQHLLDVRFPDVSRRGQGLHVASYKDEGPSWRRLTLWHGIEGATSGTSSGSRSSLRPQKTVDISSTNYIQSYCIMKSDASGRSAGELGSTVSAGSIHEAMFRFGSWCYAGQVQLTPTITLSDIPFVIPALRIQQSRMQYFCDVKNLPATNPFSRALDYAQRISPVMDDQICKSEEALRALIDRLNRMNLGDSVSRWLEGDPEDSFFEFKFTKDAELEEALRSVEVIATKAYHPSGVVTVTIIYDYTAYVTVMNSSDENPLLDSRFPDVSSKGRGYQLQTYVDGIPSWTQLRKISIWQTVDALEQEFRERASQIAQAKAQLGEDAANAFKSMLDAADEPDEIPDSKNERDERGGSSAKQLELESDSKISEAVAKIKLNESHSAPGKESSDTPAFSEKSSEQPKTDADIAGGKSEAPSSLGASPSVGRLMPVSRPHHLPKMDNALSKRMDDIRKTLGTEGEKANWSSNGSPLTAPSGLKRK